MSSSPFFVFVFWSLLFTWHYSFKSPIVSECDSFKVSHEIQSTGNTHTLDILVEGGKDPIKVILTKEGGSVISDNKFEMRHFTSLKPGTYYCTAIDSNNCKKNLEITLP